MKGEVCGERGTDSYTSSTFQNRLMRAVLLCGISTNAIHFYGFEEKKTREKKDGENKKEDGTCPKNHFK